MGYAELKVKPDISNIILNASVRADSKSAVITQMNQMVDSVLKAIKFYDIKTEDLIINNLNLYWNYIYEKEKEKKIEYSANQTIELKLKYDINEIEKLVQIAGTIPRLNFNINFDISRTRKDSLENVVSRMAIKDAEKKAFNLAAAAGLRVIKILNITYQSASPGAFTPYMKAADDVGFAQNRPIEKINLQPREIELSDNIQLTYLVRNNK